MTRLTWFLASLMLLAGCTGQTILRHPVSGQTATCDRDAREQICVDTHLRAGFSCVVGACWEGAPVDGGTVFIERRPAR
jgi:hypothetical protein